MAAIDALAMAMVSDQTRVVTRDAFISGQRTRLLLTTGRTISDAEMAAAMTFLADQGWISEFSVGVKRWVAERSKTMSADDFTQYVKAKYGYFRD